MSETRGPYRTKPRPDANAWPPWASEPDARDIHLGRIADALEGILEALVGIDARIPPAPEEHHHPGQVQFMHDHEHHNNGNEGRNNGV